MTTELHDQQTIVPSRRTPVAVWIGVWILLLWIAGVATLAQWRMAPTFDEQNHVTRGIEILRTGDYRLVYHHPPLANILQALPVNWLPGTRFTTHMPAWDPESHQTIWQAANLTIWHLSTNGVRIIRLARLSTLIFALGLGLLVFLWGRALFGPWAGLLSLALLAFDPNFLAHGGLATTDVPAACTIVLALWLLRRYVQAPSKGRFLLAGLGIGLALATKFSALILVPIAGMLLLIMVFHRADDTWGITRHWQQWQWPGRFARGFSLYMLLGLCAALTVWAIYAFHVEQFGSKPGQRVAANASTIDRIPVPAMQYFRGVKQVKSEAEKHPAYLLGHSDTTGKGWWYYFPVAVATKTPLPELVAILLMLALIICPQRRARLGLGSAELAFLLIPVGFYFLVALGVSLNLGIRHILPIYPLLLILAGGLARLAPGVRAWPALLTAFILCQLISVMFAFPNFLAYFNEAAGGSNNGYRVLADSNYDWGQDLPELAKLQRDDPQLRDLTFSYFGTTPPEAYGIQCHYASGFGLMHRSPVIDLDNFSGFLAVSATNLVGGPGYSSIDFRPLLKRHPYARAGKTIFIYRLAPGREQQIELPTAK